MVFSDSTFDSLAHRYIQACKMQHTAAYNYRNEELYNALHLYMLRLRHHLSKL